MKIIYMKNRKIIRLLKDGKVVVDYPTANNFWTDEEDFRSAVAVARQEGIAIDAVMINDRLFVIKERKK